MPIPNGQDGMTPFPGFAFFVAFHPPGGALFSVFEGVDETITGGFSDVSGLANEFAGTPRSVRLVWRLFLS